MFCLYLGSFSLVSVAVRSAVIHLQLIQPCIYTGLEIKTKNSLSLEALSSSFLAEYGHLTIFFAFCRFFFSWPLSYFWVETKKKYYWNTILDSYKSPKQDLTISLGLVSKWEKSHPIHILFLMDVIHIRGKCLIVRFIVIDQPCACQERF